jgi:hypothetical protein
MSNDQSLLTKLLTQFDLIVQRLPSQTLFGVDSMDL